MRAAAILIFGAVVRAPLIRCNLWNFLFQIAKSIFDLLDLVSRGGRLELECDDMPQPGGFGGSRFLGSESGHAESDRKRRADNKWGENVHRIFGFQ